MMETNRRTLIRTSALVVGGVVLGLGIEGAWTSEGLAQATQTGVGDGKGGGTQDGGDGVFAPNLWLKILSDDTMTFILDKSEMGQSVYTSMVMLLAEELDVKPEKFKIEMADADRKYSNPELLNIQITGGSTSVFAAYEPVRRAGATARAMLVAAAAKGWQVKDSECHTEGGFVVHGPTQQKSSYGSLARAAAQMLPPLNITLKNPSEFKIIGKTQRRLDSLLKVTGKATFGIDVVVPDALVAVLIRSPELGGTLKDFDGTEAKKLPGVTDVVAAAGGVAVVAKRYFQARKAAGLVNVQWESGPLKDFSTEGFYRELTERASTQIKSCLEKGSTQKILASHPLQVEATYRTPFLAHGTLEPQNCTADVRPDSVEIWAPTQGPGLIQQWAYEMTGVPVERIKVHSTFLGGGFGRRLYQDYAVEAIAISQAIKKPVKLIWSREDDTKNDFYRPAMVHQMKAALDQQGAIKLWLHGAAGPSILAQTLPTWVSTILPQWLPDMLKSGAAALADKLVGQWNLIPDATSMEGAQELTYPVEHHEVAYQVVNPGVPVGFWRSVGHSHTGFAVESFVDELAIAAKLDPFDFRERLLKDKLRNLGVLRRLREFSRWDTPLPQGVFRGIGIHESFRSVVGEVVELRVDGKDLRVEKVFAVIDCGTVVNPGHVEAQITGGIIFALGATLFQEITLKGGVVQQNSFDDYPLLSLTQTPQIEVAMMPSTEPPTGVGEPAVPPLAAAVANAVFRATGQRLRSLPLRLS